MTCAPLRRSPRVCRSCRRPDYRQVRRYINDIEPLFVEYARKHLRENGEAGWEADVAEVAANTKGRNLPAALRGRHPDAVALMRYLKDQDRYDPVLDGLVSAFKYDKTYFDKIVSSVGPLMEKLTTGEIKSLARRQVNLHKLTAHLTQTKNGSARTVPLTREAVAVFRVALANPVRPMPAEDIVARIRRRF